MRRPCASRRPGRTPFSFPTHHLTPPPASSGRLHTCEARAETARCPPFPPRRLLEEEEEKLKQLLQLKEKQERYIERAQQEKQELQQEMALQSRSLQQAQEQLEEVRQNRQRADEDVEVRPAGLRASPIP